LESDLPHLDDGKQIAANVTVRTEEPDKPLSPLFFTVQKITSSCVHITWDKPMYDGGLEIVDYLISYTVTERHISATSRNVMIPRDLKVNVGSPSTR
jgi:hypothetical protein